MILVIDFGGQTAHLIVRRLRFLGSPARLVVPEDALGAIQTEKPQGIVLSGGPISVYGQGAPTVDPIIFTMGIPILGICYGFQLAAHLLGGKVIAGRKEYGPASFHVQDNTSKLLKGVARNITVWMSHGDEIIEIPLGFSLIGSTPHVPNTAAEDEHTKMYMLQFHPEVEHTEYGSHILQNFIEICGIARNQHSIDPGEYIQQIRNTVGEHHVIGAISGGVDSTVAGTLVAKAIGKQLIPVFVDNGLMRDDAALTVKKVFAQFDIAPIIVDVRQEMLSRLQGITDSEVKRKVIGAFYIEVFEAEMQKLLQKEQDVAYLLQGTIYSDVIESQGTKYASKIKSHHNVGGLPEHMRLTLLEPLRELYKDEVRALGRTIGLPAEFIMKQPFPGPGFAVRIRGEVTAERLEQEKQADTIVLEELERSGWLEDVFISFPVMSGSYSTATKGDGKFFGEVIALRVVQSTDIMTATWAQLPYDLLQQISSRIVNEVPHVSRVVYDITTKPPATMEWE
jgi:GMP synthase (glutamine-hydrolysing)